MHIQTISAILLLTQQSRFTSAASSSLLRRQHSHPDDVRELDTRIIGGTEAVEGRYPYVVSLRDEYGHLCGGSLIAKDVVMTAAHCQVESYTVVVGQHDMNESTDGEELNVKQDLPHPNYAITGDEDFMLVFLDGAFENVDVVRLNYDSSVPAVGQEVTVMGWGDIQAGDAVSHAEPVGQGKDRHGGARHPQGAGRHQSLRERRPYPQPGRDRLPRHPVSLPAARHFL